MTDDRADLMLEILKRVQTMLTRLDDKIDGLAAEMRGVKTHMAAFMQSELHQDGDIAALKARIDRIERRLELVDP